MSKTKQQVLKYLIDKKNSIKLEINNLLDNKTNYCDENFFNNLVFNCNTHKNSIKFHKKNEKSIIYETKEYLNEIRILPISKILKQSNKIVTTNDRCYAFEENIFNKLNLLKEIKNKIEPSKNTKEIDNLSNIFKEENVSNEENFKRLCRKDHCNLKVFEKLKTHITNIDEEIIIKKEKLSHEIIEYSLKKKNCLPSMCNINIKDSSFPWIILKQENNIFIPIDFNERFYSYNDILGIFHLYCTKLTLINNNNNKINHGAGVHQSYKKFQQLPDMFIYLTCLNDKELLKNSDLELNVSSESTEKEFYDLNNHKTTFKGDFLLDIDNDEFYEKFPIIMYKKKQI